MSAGITKIHGQAATGAFYGYTPLVVKIAATGKFTADTVTTRAGSGSTLVTEGGYSTAVKVLQSVASIVWLGGQTANTFVAIVDQPTANQGDGAGGNAGATTGFGALKAALALALGGVAGDYTVTTATVLAGDGTFTGL